MPKKLILSKSKYKLKKVRNKTKTKTKTKTKINKSNSNIKYKMVGGSSVIKKNPTITINYGDIKLPNQYNPKIDPLTINHNTILNMATQPNITITNSNNDNKYLLIFYDPDAPNGSDSQIFSKPISKSYSSSLVDYTKNNKNYIHWICILDNLGNILEEIIPYTGPKPPFIQEIFNKNKTWKGLHNYQFIFSIYNEDTYKEIIERIKTTYNNALQQHQNPKIPTRTSDVYDKLIKIMLGEIIYHKNFPLHAEKPNNTNYYNSTVSNV